MTEIDRILLEKALKKNSDKLIECREKREYFGSIMDFVNANPHDPNVGTTMKLAAQNKMELDLLELEKKYIENRLNESSC